MKHRSISNSILVLLAVSLVMLGGCTFFSSSKSSGKKLTSYYSDSAVTAARFYFAMGDGYETEELPSDQIEAFVERLDSMALEKHSFHTDYFWGGKYGIELDLEDGTFLDYDGTKISLRDVSIVEDSDSEHKLKNQFVEVTDCEFWSEMMEFFTSDTVRRLAGK